MLDPCFISLSLDAIGFDSSKSNVSHVSLFINENSHTYQKKIVNARNT